MAPRILYLFPDTNLFIQCRALDQLGWMVWKEFDEVHLIVSRPVQSEIDHQKNRGNDRLRRRARTASSLLREIILGGAGYRLVRDADPTVKLFIRQDLKPNPDLSDSLDYQNEPDDRLVGTAHAFIQQNPRAEVRILTHDTGPMASARMVGLPVEPIPDEWLVPPESTDA
jgi:predicted ribonuclease YlaK